MKFDNGITLSTQFGSGNYCENRSFLDELFPETKNGWVASIGSNDTEIAIWNEKGDWLTKEMNKEVFGYELDDNVSGNITMFDWLLILDWCRRQYNG